MNLNNASDKKKGTFMTDPGLIKQKIENSVERSPPIISKPIEDEEITERKNEIIDKKVINKNLNIFNQWETLYDRILFRPPFSSYYQKFPITPGTNFIKKLFSHDKSEKLIQNLKINIPETYWNDSEIYYIFNDPNNYNQLTMIKNRREFDIFENFKSIEKNFYKRDFEGEKIIDPFLVTRLKDSDYENIVKVICIF